MANCVNIHSQSFKELKRQTNLSEKVLQAKVGLWQEKNGIENYPTKEDIFSNMPIEKRLGIYKKELSYQQTIGVKKNVEIYNKNNNTSYFVAFTKVGQADIYTWKIEDKNNGQTSLFQLNLTPSIIEEEKQRFEKEGITLNQKSTIPIINKLLYRAITPATYDKTAITKKALTSVVFGRNYEDFKEIVEQWKEEGFVPDWAENITEEQYQKREDAWLLSNGLPQKNNTFKYIGRGFIKNGEVTLNKNGEDIYDFNKPVFNDVDIDRNSSKNYANDKTNFVMGKYALSTGRDNTGYYLQYSDRWDLDVNNNFIQKTIDVTQNPFIVVGKLYKAGTYDEEGNFSNYYTHESDNPDINNYTEFMARMDTEMSPEKSTNYEQPASPKTISLIKDFLKRIGVDIAKVNDIVKDGVKQDADAVALLGQKLIQVVNGKEETSLPEEAMHFAIEIIKQTNPTLYNQLLKEINKYNTYKEVQENYGKHPDYQTKEGKPDILKLKEEAIGKVLAETIINKLENSSEKPELAENTRSLWEKIKDFLKSLFTKSGFDQLSLKIINGEDIGTSEDINSTDSFYQLNTDKQNTIFNNLVSKAKDVEKKDQEYFVDGRKIKRVTTLVKEWYERRLGDGNLTKSDFQQSIDDLKAEQGTKGHSYFEKAYDLFINKDTGLLRGTKLDDSDFINTLDAREQNIYKVLKDNFEQRLNSYPEGTKFLSEVTVYNPKQNIGGTIDLLTIEPNGKVGILDWKFMDLNTDKFKDVPWYKVAAWNLQMGKYKQILSQAYGIKNEEFGQTAMIPIQAIYSQANAKEKILPKLLEVRIGDVNVKNIDKDFLLPVPTPDQKTGNKKVDALIIKLNKVYEKLSKEKVLPDEKQNKAEQLNALFGAIRLLQVKEDIKPLINQAKVLSKQVEMLFNRYEMEFKGKSKEGVGDKVDTFAGLLRVNIESLEPYLSLDKELKSLFMGELSPEDKELQKDLKETVDLVGDYKEQLQELDKSFGEEFIGANFSPERAIKGIGKWLSTTSKLQSVNISNLYVMANKAFALSNMENQTQVVKLKELKQSYQSWVKSKGLNVKNQFDILMKKGSNSLISEYNPEFYTELNKRIQDKDFKWLKDNVDVEAYKKHLSTKLEEDIERIKNRPRTGTETEIVNEIRREITRARDLYDISTLTSVGWLLKKQIRKFPNKEIWHSKEWKELTSPENKPAKDFYDYIVERNEYSREIGYLNNKSTRKFLPWMRKGLIEKLVFGGKISLGEQFLRSISLDENEAGYGELDPLTGKPINTIPKYFLREIEDDYSTDLFKTMALYNEYSIKFKNLSDIEESSLALLRAEQNKGSIATSVFGKTLTEDGEVKYNDNNTENSELLHSMIKAIIYGQKYVSSESFDHMLGSLGNFGEKLNTKLGMKIFPENLTDRQISVNKSLTQLNNIFQLNTLGFNSLSALSNSFGGRAQGLINSGKYFTKTDFIQTQGWILQNKMTGGADRKLALAALDYFVPFTENYNKHAASHLSLNKLDDQAVQDYLMIMMRNGDQAVQVLNFFSFLKNSVVLDDKIVNAREYLKTTPEFNNLNRGTQEERKAKKLEYEQAIKSLVEDKGVLKLSSVKDGKLEIPGIERTSDSVIELRRKVQSFTADALGSMTEENKRLLNLNVYGSSMMIFKNWIPRLVEVRTGDISYNAASDAYEWGRMRMVFSTISDDALHSLGNLKNILMGNDKGMEYIRHMFEKKSESYFKNTGKELQMTEDEFIDLMRQGVKNQALDLAFYVTMIALFAGLKAIPPDKDEDPSVINQYRFLLKATDKLKDEITYFYNPTSFSRLISQGIFPSIALIENYGKILSNFMKENYDYVKGNDEKLKKDYTLKYIMKSFPISSQIASYLPMFYPALAKDLGMKMQSQYGFQ